MKSICHLVLIHKSTYWEWVSNFRIHYDRINLVIWHIELAQQDLKYWLTSEGKDEDTDGNDPWHSAVALPKLLHQVLEKDTKALKGPICADFHYEESSSHSPAPATIGDLQVNIWT